MRRTNNLTNLILVTVIATLFTGCETVTPAPGSDKVRLTRDPKEVVGCKAVGNISVPKAASGLIDAANADTEFRNRTIGLGGNTALVTSGVADTPVEGIAYHCE